MQTLEINPIPTLSQYPKDFNYRIETNNNKEFRLYIQPFYYKAVNKVVWQGLFKRLSLVKYEVCSGPFLPVVERCALFSSLRDVFVCSDPDAYPKTFMSKTGLDKFLSTFKPYVVNIKDLEQPEASSYYHVERFRVRGSRLRNCRM